MKKVFSFAVFYFAVATASAQFVYKIKGDSILLSGDSCVTELIIQNHTKDVCGFLFNKGNGRTEFRSALIKLNDTTYLVGCDTLRLHQGLTGITANNGLTMSTPTNVQLGGTGIQNTNIDWSNFTWSNTWNTLAGSTGFQLSSTSAAAASNQQKLLQVSLGGSNSNSGQTTYSTYVSNTHTGSGSTNIGGYFAASGGTNNYAILVPDASGYVGIGISPVLLFHVDKSNRNLSNTASANQAGAVNNNIILDGTTLTGNKGIIGLSGSQVVNFDVNQTINNATDFASVYSLLELSNTNPATLSYTQGANGTIRAVTATKSVISIPSLNASSVISNMSNTHITAIQSPATGTISNYYGLFIEGAKDNATNLNITNLYGIYQEGVNDSNLFVGPMLLKKLQTGGAAPATIGTTKMVISDANGLLSFADIPSGAASITAANGLTDSSNRVILGGTLYKNTTVDNGSNTLTFSGTGTQTLLVTNTANVGVYGHVSGSNVGVQGVADGSGGVGLRGEADNSNGTGVSAVAATGTGLTSSTTSGLPAYLIATPSSNNSVITIMKMLRGSTSTPSAGIGSSIDYLLTTSNGSTSVTSTQLISKLTTPTTGSEVSQFSVSGINNGGSQTLQTLDGNGQLTLNQYTSSNFNGGSSNDSVLVVTSGGIVKKRNAALFGTPGGFDGKISSLVAATNINSIDNGSYNQSWSWNALAGGTGLALSANSTAATGNTQQLLALALGGTNTTSGQRTTTLTVANGHDGGSSTNVGAQFQASGGTNNYAIIVPSGQGNVGIGTSTPGATNKLDVIATTSDNAVSGTTVSGTGIIGTAIDGFAGFFNVNPSSTNSVVDIMRIRRSSSGTAANGIGGSISFQTQDASGSPNISNTVTSKWTNATSATRTSQLEISGVNSGTTARKLAIAGTGQLILDNYTSASSFTGTAVASLSVDASGNVITTTGMTNPMTTTGDLIVGGSGGTPTRLAVGSAGTHLISNGTTESWKVATTSQSTPSNPTGTSNTTGVMMGLAGSITPAYSGKIMIIISGDIKNATNADGGKVQIRFGTGTAPTNGATATGTAAGGFVNFNNAAPSTVNIQAPFSLNAIVSGLTVGTPVWVDIDLAAITGGTVSIKDLSISIVEL